MEFKPTIKEEIETINRELAKSLLKLQALLEKKQRALDEAELFEERGEKALIEKTISDIERKIREIKSIGFSTLRTNRQ